MQGSFLLNSTGGFASQLDARLKLFMCACVSMSTIFFSSPYALLVLLCGATMFAMSSTSFKVVILVWLASSFMMLVTTGFSWLLSLLVPNMFSWDILRLSVPYLRMLVTVMLLISLALSTPIQVIVANLYAVRLPGFLAIPLAVGIRFIPSFMDDCKQIRDAVRLRPNAGFLSMWRGVVVPLIFRVLASADDLSVAAEIKGLAPDKSMSPMDKKILSGKDYSVFTFACLLFMLAVLLQKFGPQVMPLRG